MAEVVHTLTSADGRLRIEVVRRPTGVTVLMQPIRGNAAGRTHSQGCENATLGFAMQPLRGKCKSQYSLDLRQRAAKSGAVQFGTVQKSRVFRGRNLFMT